MPVKTTDIFREFSRELRETLVKLQNDVSELRTSVALLDQEADARSKEVTGVVVRLDTILTSFQLLVTQFEVKASEQTSKMSSMEQKLEDIKKRQQGIEQNFSDWKDQVKRDSDAAIEKLEARITKLEGWRLWLLGAGTVAGAAASAAAQWVLSKF
jgi:chromosome segregation ATPase